MSICHLGDERVCRWQSEKLDSIPQSLAIVYNSMWVTIGGGWREEGRILDDFIILIVSSLSETFVLFSRKRDYRLRLIQKHPARIKGLRFLVVDVVRRLKFPQY